MKKQPKILVLSILIGAAAFLFHQCQKPQDGNPKKEKLGVMPLNDLISFALDVRMTEYDSLITSEEKCSLLEINNNLNNKTRELQTKTAKGAFLDCWYYPCGDEDGKNPNPDEDSDPEEDNESTPDTSASVFVKSEEMPRDTSCCPCPEVSVLLGDNCLVTEVELSEIRGFTLLYEYTNYLTAEYIALLDENGNEIKELTPQKNTLYKERDKTKKDSFAAIGFPMPEKRIPIVDLQFKGTLNGKGLDFKIAGKLTEDGWMGERRLKEFKFE